MNLAADEYDAQKPRIAARAACVPITASGRAPRGRSELYAPRRVLLVGYVTDTEAPTQGSVSVPVGRPIALHIAGGDLLLDGRFNHWIPVAVMNDNPDLGVVQLLCDSTSPANDLASGSSDPQREAPDAQSGAARADLFRFDSKKVRPKGKHVFLVEGTLGTGEEEHGVEVVVHLPQGHSPFFFVTVPIDRKRFPELWSHIEDKVIAPIADQQEMRPLAWLRAPLLAAA
jgi:hypothetical protein